MALGKGLSSLIPQQKSSTRRIVHKETETLHKEGQLWHIPISEIVPNPDQPRKEFSHSALEDLVDSIKKHGILQPITVSEKTNGEYEIVAGERRFRSAQIAGLATVPAIVRAVTDQEKLEIGLIENIQRQNLNPIEEAFAYKRLIEEFGLTQKEVAEQVGKQRPTIGNMIRLLDLPEQIQKALIDEKISTGKARALLSLKSEREQMEMFASMIGEKMSVRDVEKSVSEKGNVSRKGSIRKDPNIRAQEEILEDRFGTKVHISQKGKKGKIIIEYYSKEELKRLIETLS